MLKIRAENINNFQYKIGTCFRVTGMEKHMTYVIHSKTKNGHYLIDLYGNSLGPAKEQYAFSDKEITGAFDSGTWKKVNKPKK